jgi:hypothetical protein
MVVVVLCCVTYWQIKKWITTGMLFIQLTAIHRMHLVLNTVITTRKHVFSNRFSDQNISVALATDLETDILTVKVKKYSVTKSVAT